jgi:hypothetical protein
MKEFSGQLFTVVTYRLDDPEASSLGALIQQSLERAGWKYSLSTPLDWLDTGVSVEIASSSAPKLAPIASALVDGLNAQGVATKRVHTEKYERYPDTIFVVVGKKPPSAPRPHGACSYTSASHLPGWVRRADASGLWRLRRNTGNPYPPDCDYAFRISRPGLWIPGSAFSRGPGVTKG